MNPVRNLSIKHKLIVIVLLVTIPSIVVGFSIIIFTDILDLRENLVNNAHLDAGLLAENLIGPMSFNDPTGVSDVLSKIKALPDIETAFVFGDGGGAGGDNRLVASYHRDAATASAPPPRVPSGTFHRFTDRHLEISQPVIFHGETLGMLYMEFSTLRLGASIRSRIVSLLSVMGGVILLSYLLALWFQGMISGPILTLARVTENISHQADYSLRVQKQGRDEIGILYDGFNNMLEQIQLWMKKRDEAQAGQKRLLEQLEEKNSELEQVVYVTSHDLRSPLVNIQGFSEELALTLKELEELLNELGDAISPETRHRISSLVEDDILDSLKYIRSSTSKMDALLSGLLRLSRVGRGAWSPGAVDMNELMSEVVSVSEYQLKESGVTLRLEQLPPCFGDGAQINQVFSNLLGNALKYLSPDRPGEILIGAVESDTPGRVVYVVSDNGIGIAPEHRQKVFELFRRLNPQDSPGEGLGLSIVHKIVSRHGGSVWVESGVNVGSRFFVSLPALQ